MMEGLGEIQTLIQVVATIIILIGFIMKILKSGGFKLTDIVMLIITVGVVNYLIKQPAKTLDIGGIVINALISILKNLSS